MSAESKTSTKSSSPIRTILVTVREIPFHAIKTSATYLYEESKIIPWYHFLRTAGAEIRKRQVASKDDWEEWEEFFDMDDTYLQVMRDDDEEEIQTMVIDPAKYLVIGVWIVNYPDITPDMENEN